MPDSCKDALRRSVNNLYNDQILRFLVADFIRRVADADVRRIV